MSASDEATRPQNLCGKWMPRLKTYCGRGAGHTTPCRPPEFMEWQRQKARAADRPYDLIAARRCRSTHELTRYGLTPEKFDKMLAGQGYACGMCLEPFKDGQRIHIDHDHNLGCHPGEKQACDRCRRGLLCVPCNTALGVIESRRYTQVRQYLKRWRAISPGVAPQRGPAPGDGSRAPRRSVRPPSS